jgi:hypothetical protein
MTKAHELLMLTQAHQAAQFTWKIPSLFARIAAAEIMDVSNQTLILNGFVSEVLGKFCRGVWLSSSTAK